MKDERNINADRELRSRQAEALSGVLSDGCVNTEQLARWIFKLGRLGTFFGAVSGEPTDSVVDRLAIREEE